jgi:site-specific DNA recombinase
MTNATTTATRPAVARGYARQAPPRPEPTAEVTSPRAVVYLRVSSPSQVKTDYNPEGISLPAQRDACKLKCSSLGAEIAREFVEPGRSATSTEKRIVFQEMMAWIKANKDSVDYLVVYHFNRIFRNSIDAHLAKRDLKGWGVRLVSTVMDFGEGPESDMVESILSAVDEYRVKADGADISYKMGAKARNGGTIGRARLGYVNARDLSEGRNIGIVKVDPERAPLVIAAFELYASGDYSLEALQAELTIRGLTTRPGRFPAGPISTSKLAKLLCDPYYMGYVSYQGELIEGRHEALIGHELFDRVQLVLEQRGGGGSRDRRHHHYLKGVLWCGNCDAQGVQSRMLLQWTNGNGGRYLYFFCIRKQQHLCDSRYVESDAIEVDIENYYATISFPEDLAERLRQRMRETLDEEEKATRLLNQQLRAEIERLNKQEENLIDLAAEGGLAVAKVKQRLAEIHVKRDQVSGRLNESGERLEAGVRLIDNALKLLDDPHGTYQRMSPEQRRLMNQAIIEKAYVQRDRIDKVTFRPPFDELLLARDEAQAAQDWTERPDAAGIDGEHERRFSGVLTPVLVGVGSSNDVMVGATGLEPVTSAV